MESATNNRSTEIIELAAKLFCERGYAATSIRDIGEAMGTTSAALYYHFKNKEELLLEVMRAGLSAIEQEVKNVAESESDIKDKINAALKAHLKISLTHQDFAVVILQSARNLSAEAQEEIIRSRASYEALWNGLFAEGIKAGVLRDDLEPALLRKLIFGALNNIVFWFKSDGEHSAEEITDAFLSTITEGIVK